MKYHQFSQAFNPVPKYGFRIWRITRFLSMWMTMYPSGQPPNPQRSPLPCSMAMAKPYQIETASPQICNHGNEICVKNTSAWPILFSFNKIKAFLMCRFYQPINVNGNQCIHNINMKFTFDILKKKNVSNSNKRKFRNWIYD